MMNLLPQTYARSHFRMCCGALQVIRQDYQQARLPPLSSLCQLPTVVESPWEPLQCQTWISMSCGCQWPLCPTLFLKVHTTHLLVQVHAHTTGGWGLGIHSCAVRYFTQLFFLYSLALLRQNIWEYETGSLCFFTFFTYVFNNSRRRVHPGNVSSCDCQQLCNISQALSNVITKLTAQF